MKFVNLEKSYLVFFIISLFLIPVKADENKITNSEHEFNFYSGMFDFSDDNKRSMILGIQHQNESLYRDSFFGVLSPVTGALITSDSASYVYTGVQAQYKLGKMHLTPSFTPGLYLEGDGKDLGHLVEFKSEIQLSLDLSDKSEFGFSYNHISNASLGEKNPGANSYIFNFLKKF